MNENNEQTGTGHTEGNPAVEQAEQNVLGTTTYQKVEVLHRFADTHPWFHPALAMGAVLVIICIAIAIRRFMVKRSNQG